MENNPTHKCRTIKFNHFQNTCPTNNLNPCCLKQFVHSTRYTDGVQIRTYQFNMQNWQTNNGKPEKVNLTLFWVLTGSSESNRLWYPSWWHRRSLSSSRLKILTRRQIDNQTLKVKQNEERGLALPLIILLPISYSLSRLIVKICTAGHKKINQDLPQKLKAQKKLYMLSKMHTEMLLTYGANLMTTSTTNLDGNWSR